MPMLPKDCRDHGTDITVMAGLLATREPAEAEALIAALIAEALDRWLLDDATFWQRVRFRTRRLRVHARQPGPAREPRFC